MARIEWDQAGIRHFNAGLDRGVLYVDGKVVPWNGLISVEERSTGGEIVPTYLDGIRIRNTPSLSEYEATLTAFYSPPEFDACDGILESQHYGFFATNQKRKPFGLSYRTGASNDLDSTNYKIHLIYNAMVEPSSTTYETLSPSNTASALSWDIKAVPNFNMTQHVSAHYIFDTTKAPDYLVSAFEDIIYGTDTTVGRLPTEEDIEKVFVEYWGLTVTDYGGSYIISGSDYAVKNLGDRYQISDYGVVKNETAHIITGD